MHSPKALVHRLRKDYAFRTFVFAFMSLGSTFAFAAYNFFLGAAYVSAFHACLALYFLSLCGVRGAVFLTSRRTTDELALARAHLAESAALFVVDAALIAPLAMMVIEQRPIVYASGIPAIAFAAYTTCKVVLAIYNYRKASKQASLGVRMFKCIGLMDACVSLLSLQFTLVHTFGDSGMLPTCAANSFLLWALLILISARAVYTAARSHRAVREEAPR